MIQVQAYEFLVQIFRIYFYLNEEIAIFQRFFINFIK